jgi:hypothetical protein
MHQRIPKAIAVFELIGGAYATVVGLMLLTRAMSAGQLGSLRPPALFTLAGIVSLVAGIRLFRDPVRGHRFALLVLVAQVPLVLLPWLQYSAFFLLRAGIKLVDLKTAFFLDFGGEILWFIGSGTRVPAEHVVGLNVLSIVMAAALWQLGRARRDEGQVHADVP